MTNKDSSKRLVDLMWPKLPLRHQIPAILCLTLGITLTAFLFTTVSGWERKRIQSEFEYDSNISLQYLAREIAQYENRFVTHAQLLYSLQTYHGSDFDQHFREFAQRAFLRHPAVEQVVYVAHTADGQPIQYACRRTDDGFRSVSPAEIDLDPGLIEEATGGGQMFSSKPFLPGDGIPSGYCVNVITPIVSPDPYRPEPGQVAQPEAYLCARVHLKEFLLSVLAGYDREHLDYRFDADAASGGTYVLDLGRRFEGVRSEPADAAQDPSPSARFARSEPVAIAGRIWNVMTAPTGAYLDLHSTDWSWWVVIGGLMLSIVLSDYFVVLAVRLSTFELMVKDHVDALVQADVQLARQRNLHHETSAQLSRLHEAIDDCPTAIIITDGLGRVEYVNYRVIDMTGCTREELMGKIAPIFEAGRLPEPLARELHEAFAEGREWWGEYRDRDQNGDLKYVEATTSPIRNDTGESTHHVIMIADISERKHLQEQFLQSQKMEVIGRLAGGVVHDLSNMLTVILGFSQIVQSQLEPDSPIRNDIDEIIRVTEKAGELNRQLLAFARTRAHRTETVDPNQSLDDMDKFLRRTLGEDINLHVSRGDDVGSIEVDPGQLNQLIMNLAVNARDAMPEGGDLYIKTRRSDLPANLCRVHRLPPGDYVMLSVRDTGFGMSEDVRTRLFEPFFTTKAEGQGTGLGLSTVYGIVKRFNGAIEVESEPGEGTEFRAYFPLSQLQPEQDAHEVKAAVPTGHETVLVVEDDPDLRQLCRALLGGLGYTVLEAIGGRQGLEIFQKKFGEIDLVLTDIVMPDINGVDLARRMKLVQPDVRFMFTTGFSEHAVLHRVGRDSRGLLRKPFTRAKLGHAVREALDAFEPTIDIDKEFVSAG